MEINYLRKKNTSVFLLIFLLKTVCLFSLSEWDVQIEPDRFALETGLKSSLNHEEFMEAAFYFSGVKRYNLPVYMDKYRKIQENFKSFLLEKKSSEASDAVKGELLLEYLHNNVFSVYEEFATSAAVLLDKGLFNCVSSGIIYYALSEASGLDAGGILTDDHAFCTVNTGTVIIDVETTTAYGFNPGEKKDFADSFGKTGFIYTPPGNYRNRKIIGKKDFLALILQNRIAKLQKDGNFIGTVPLSVDRHFILNNSESYKDMLNEFKNYCVVLNNRKNYKEALLFIECLYSEYGFSEIISDTAATLFRNSIIDSMAAEEIESAFDLFYQYSRFPLISSKIKSEMFFEINEKELYLEIQKGDFRKSLSFLYQKRDNGEIPEKVFYEYYVFIYSSEVETVSESSGWVSALGIINESLEKSDDKRLLQLKKAVIYNIGVIYHNKFADLFNNRKYEKAKAAALEGLEIVPDDRKLLADLKNVNQVLNSR